MANIYISHGYRDLNLAQEMARGLQSAGHTVAFDDNLVKPGDEWREILWDALNNSDTFVVMFSEQSPSPRYVMYEAGAARALKKKVFPVIVGDCPIPLPVQDLMCICVAETEIDKAVKQICQVIGP